MRRHTETAVDLGAWIGAANEFIPRHWSNTGDDDSQIAYTGFPVNNDRSAFVMNADGSGSQVIAEVGNEWGMDWIP